jgi:hypothetical protein
MLAAASPAGENFPALFHLALEILSTDRALPPELSKHLQAVVTQALSVAADPTSVAGDTLAESIQLALKIRNSDQLRSAIEPARQNSIDAEHAKRILSMERALETAC